jgi:hypothetical protein
MNSTIFASLAFGYLAVPKPAAKTFAQGSTGAWAPKRTLFELRWLKWMVALLVCVPALIAQTNLQPDTHVGDFNFKMPEGWERMPAQSGSVATLTATHTSPGTSTIIALGSYGIVTDLKTSFTKVWQTLQQQSRLQQKGQIATNRLPGGNESMAVSATMADRDGKQWNEMILLAQNGNRSELVLFATNDLQPDAYSSAYHALIALLASLRFTPEDALPGAASTNQNQLIGTGGPPARSESRSGSMWQASNSQVVVMPAPAGRLSGIYRAPAAQVPSAANLDFADPASHTPNHAFLTFFPDGRVKRGLIQRGFNEYKDESQFRHDIASGGNTASQWGLYQISGGQGSIVFADARLAGQQLVSGLRGEIWGFTVGQGSLQVNGVTYTLLDGGIGLALEGTFKPSGDRSQPGIRFTRDGQFVDEGILDTHSNTAVGIVGGGLGIGYGFSSPHAGSGTYRISNYGLVISYANGQAPSTLFFLDGGADRNAPQVLYIDDVEYQRVQ